MVKEVVAHIHRGILVIKKSEILPCAATWMGLEIITLSEVSQMKKSIAYMWNLFKMIDVNLFTKAETDSQTQGMNLRVPGREEEGRLGVWD